MNDAAEQLAYLILLRVFFSSYSRRITDGSKPSTTAELARLGKPFVLQGAF
jgi:hypothetical protein